MDIPLRHDLLEIAQAQRIAKIPANAQDEVLPRVWCRLDTVARLKLKLNNLNGKNLLPDSSLTLQTLNKAKQSWSIAATAPDGATCPDCGVLSRARHSSYWRGLKDLPIQGRSVQLKLQVGRWRCRNSLC
jgi:hypothetical protein